MKYCGNITLILIFLVNTYNSIDAFETENDRHARIIGGKNWTESSPLNPSFMVAIMRAGAVGLSGSDIVCAGSLIGPKTVLTAAQCCDLSKNRKIQVRFDGTVLEELAQSKKVDNMIKHPKYNSTNKQYDFCIMTLANPPVKESSTVKFVELANCTPLNGSSIARTAGWGRSVQDGKWYPVFKTLDMKILSSRECKKLYPSSDQDRISNESQICATSENGSVCKADQGGPLLYDAELVGVVSRPGFFDTCPNNSITKPNVFGDTVKVKDWILDNLK